MAKRKKWLCVIVAVCICAVTIGAISFADGDDYIAMLVDVPVAVINGEGAAIDESGEVVPYIKDNRTMLPVRFVAQSLSAQVGWDATTQTVTITKGADVLTMVIGERVMYKNGQAIELDVAPEITHSRTMVPVRAVAEGLNKYVHWRDGLIIIVDADKAGKISDIESKVISDAESLCRKYNIKPLAVNISWGGQMLAGFSPMQNTYTIRPQVSDPSKLSITAVGDSFSDCTVQMPESIPGDIKVIVKPRVFNGLENVYTIKVKEPLPFKVRASTYQQGNGPENSVDDDFSTRWAAEGNQWIMYEFNEPVEISKVKIAFWKASKTRKASFRIQIRENPTDEWITVFKGSSTYETEELESFEFEPQKAKFVRIYGYGNTENKWNSILEVKIE